MNTITQEHIAEAISKDFTTTVFPELWNNLRHEFDNSSKKELAEEMFYAGAINMLMLLHSFAEQEEMEVEQWE